MQAMTPYPVFTSTAEAAGWVEKFLRDALTRDPQELHLDNRRTERTFTEDDIHFTELADSCYRRPVLRLLGAPRDYGQDEEMHWAHTGMLYEEWVRAVFRREFPGRLKSNREVPQRPAGTQGYYDLWWADANTVIDVKSRSIHLEAPLEKDKTQVAMYAASLTNHLRYSKRDPNFPPVKALLVYTRREELRVDVYPVEYDVDTMSQHITQAAATLRTWKQLKQAPPVPTAMDPFKAPCSFRTKNGEWYCPFYSQCHTAVAPRVATPAPEAMAALVHHHFILSERRKELERQAKEFEKDEKDLKVQMAPFFQEHGNLLRVEDLPKDVRWVVVGPKETYNVAAALEKDPALKDRLEPYKEQKPGYNYPLYVNRKEA